jgi:thiaminase/transcriptional activator TenA
VGVFQDALYLREYARALSLAGVRSPDENALVMFNEHSAGAITVERGLHDGFPKAPPARASIQTTTLSLRFASHLLHQARNEAFCLSRRPQG